MQIKRTGIASAVEHQAEQRSGQTSVRPEALPIVYREGSQLGLVYRIKPEVAAAALSDLPFEPLILWGKALVVLGAFEYRDTDIGPYAEIGLCMYVKRPGSSPSKLQVLRKTRVVEDVAMYVFNLPVNTDLACRAGMALWGYPKYVSEIQTSFTPNRVDIQLGQEFRLSHERGWGLPWKAIPFITYSILEQRLLRTITEVDHPVQIGGARTVKLTLLGKGPTASKMRALGLEHMQPTLAFRTDGLRSILPAGKDMGPILNF